MAILMLAPYAGILALLYIALAVSVVRLRYRHRVALGTGDHEPLVRAIRAHANFSEYVPLALLLLYFVAELGISPLLIHALAALLLIGRILHAYSLLVHEPRKGGWPVFRTAGMVCSFTVLGITGIALLFAWVQFHGQ